MTSATDQQTLLHNSVNAEILLARMDERLKGLETKFDKLTDAVEAKRVPWVQVWGPIVTGIIALATVYGTLSSDIRALQTTDARSIQQRQDMDRRIERLELSFSRETGHD